MRVERRIIVTGDDREAVVPLSSPVPAEEIARRRAAFRQTRLLREWLGVINSKQCVPS